MRNKYNQVINKITEQHKDIINELAKKRVADIQVRMDRFGRRYGTEHIELVMIHEPVIRVKPKQRRTNG